MATTMPSIAGSLTETTSQTAALPPPSTTNNVPSQAGILEGSNPTVYDAKNPLTLFIIQAGIIIVFCRLLHWPLSRIKQPRVIAEVIGGILLGPSVMGRIPHFTETIFPVSSMPAITMAANLGLVLFLFLVGLEVDLRYLLKHWRVALSVGCAGMALPFGLGCAIAWGLYEAFRHEPGTSPIDFPVYMLFIGVAMAITAFPVLCRILTELKLLTTPVGVTVLAAGVSNDVVGWVLLALCVALVNAGSGLTALWVLLACVGWVLFLSFAVRPVFMIILRRTRSIQDGPSQSVVALTLLIALTSAFFTGIIGVHPIFGAFLAGLICPHEGGFAIKVTEKVEDLVSTLLLPLYFALSGLSTNLGLLDSGKAWGYVVAVIVVAFLGKMIGGSGAARLNGCVWRECFTIGTLMSCKGLVELIVLNIGLQARILTTRTFTIFVVMALVTTFATTPLTSWLYPPWYQSKLEAWKRGEIDWDTGRRRSSTSHDDEVQVEKYEAAPIYKFLVYLRLDSLPTTLTMITSLQQHRTNKKSGTAGSELGTVNNDTPDDRILAHGLRLLPLTERDSSVMKVSEVAEYSLHDPVVNTFLAFGTIHNVSTSGEVGIASESSYAYVLAEKAREMSSDLLLLPWSASGSLSEASVVSTADSKSTFASSPFDAFIQETFEVAHDVCHVAVMINNGFGTVVGGKKDQRSIVVPFFGTADDRVALRLALQLANNYEAHVLVQPIDIEFEHENDTDEVRARSASSEKPAGNTTTARALPPTDKRDRFLSAIKATPSKDNAQRLQLLAPTGCTLIQESLRALENTTMSHVHRQNSLLLLGRNQDAPKRPLTRAKTGDSVADNTAAPSSLGNLADQIILSQARHEKHKATGNTIQACSMLVVQSRRTH